LKSPLVFIAVLVAFAGIGAYMTTGGFSDDGDVLVERSSALDVGLISRGESVELAEFAAQSGRTVFFFTKPWCGACWRLAPRVEELAREDDTLALRIVDIDSWESDVARQHGIVATPHLVLYEDGRRIAGGLTQVLDRLAP